MLPSKASWRIHEADQALVQHIHNSLQLHPRVVELLVKRNVSTSEEIETFIYSDDDQFHDPFLLDGMHAAIDCIQSALRNHSKILIYGDYDADGITSTALLFQVLKQLHAHVDYYIPHRVQEGYGLNAHAIHLAKHNGVSLIITVDNGISAVKEVALINELGMKVIITDHHEPPQVLPEAVSIINPKKTNCSYPYKHLAGVGVVFKLAQALLGTVPIDLTVFAAIGTIADIMPLTGENRLLAKRGIERMQHNAPIGLRSLFQVAGIDPKRLTSGNIGFSLAPRMNASGRLEHANEAVRLLITADQTEADDIAYHLDELNKERQQLVVDITIEAAAQAEYQRAKHTHTAGVIVVAQEGWNIGVVGIVAAKLVERYYRPAFVLHIDTTTGLTKGSARSIKGFDLYQALTHCQQWLIHYGGHQAAAGITMKTEHLEVFTHKLNELAQAWLTVNDLMPTTEADFICDLHEVTLPLIEQLQLLAPFGAGHPTPKAILRNVLIDQIHMIGKDKLHVKIVCSYTRNGKRYQMDALGFGKAHLATFMSPGARIDLLAELSMNEWNGNQKPQIIIHDISITHVQIFDWRDIREVDSRIDQLLLDLTQWSHPITHIPPAIIMLSSTNLEQVTLHSWQLTCPIWVLTSTQQLLPYNEVAKSSHIEHMSDVILYSSPASIEAVQEVLQQAQGMQRCYVVFRKNLELTEPMEDIPSRELFKRLYVWLQQHGGCNLAQEAPFDEFMRHHQVTLQTVQKMIQVFVELALIECTSQQITICSSNEKKTLESSMAYQQHVKRYELQQTVTHAHPNELKTWILKQGNVNHK